MIAVSVVVQSISLTGCTTGAADSSAPSAAFAHGVIAPEQDWGPASEQEGVRRAAVAALTDEGRAFVVSARLRGAEPAAVLSALTDPAVSRSRSALLERAGSASLAAALRRSFSVYAEQEFGTDRTGRGSRSAWLDHDVWATSTFHVDRWQGVRVGATTARVIVRGEDRGTSWGGDLVRDAWAQYKLVLRRDATAPHGWRVVHEQAASTAA